MKIPKMVLRIVEYKSDKESNLESFLSTSNVFLKQGFYNKIFEVDVKVRGYVKTTIFINQRYFVMVSLKLHSNPFIIEAVTKKFYLSGYIPPIGIPLFLYLKDKKGDGDERFEIIPRDKN